MSKAPIARKALMKAQKSTAGKPPKKKKSTTTTVAREPRVIAREHFDKQSKAKQDAEKRLLDTLFAEHTKQVAKPLYSTYFMKVTNRIQKVVRECLKANGNHYIAPREDADVLFRLHFTHGQKETLETLTLYGIIQDDDRLCMFLDEAHTLLLQSEQGMSMLIHFANSASHAAPDAEAHLSSKQQLALFQHFTIMLAQDLQERIERVKREFHEHDIVEPYVVKHYLVDGLK